MGGIQRPADDHGTIALRAAISEPQGLSRTFTHSPLLQGRLNCAFTPTLAVTYHLAQHSSQPLCPALPPIAVYHHLLLPTNGPDQDTRNTSQIARHGT